VVGDIVHDIEGSAGIIAVGSVTNVRLLLGELADMLVCTADVVVGRGVVDGIDDSVELVVKPSVEGIFDDVDSSVVEEIGLAIFSVDVVVRIEVDAVLIVVLVVDI